MSGAREVGLDCEAVARALWDFLDGRCEQERHALVQEHLAMCASCRSHAEFERALLDQIGASSKQATGSEALRGRVLQAVRDAARAARGA